MYVCIDLLLCCSNVHDRNNYTNIQSFKPVTHKSRKHSIMFMMKTMLRKTLNGNNNSIVYKFVFNKDKRNVKSVPYI